MTFLFSLIAAPFEGAFGAWSTNFTRAAFWSIQRRPAVSESLGHRQRRHRARFPIETTPQRWLPVRQIWQ